MRTYRQHRHMPHNDLDPLLDQIVGLGEHSMRKNYYPELQKRLRELQRFRTLLDFGNDLILLVALPQGIIADANLPLCRRLDWPREALLGQPLALVLPGSDLDALLDSDAESSHFETYFHSRNGETFPVDLTCRVSSDGTAADDDDGRMALIVARDITERLFFECRLHAEMERTARANVAKSKFLAAASHDLRQPAQSLTLFTSLLASTLTGHPAARIVDHLSTSVDALHLLLDSLLDVSRLDAGLVVPDPRPFAVETILGPLRQEYQARAAEKGLRLTVQRSGHWVVSDPVLLSSILRNLIENAIRYTRTGGILVGCRKRRGHIALQVWDSGVGLAPDELSNIFEEFYQIGNPERDRRKGLGLGLAIVRRLAELLGHCVEVRSIQGKGSCFSLVVDAAERIGVSPPAPSTPPPACCAGLSLLVVEDDAVVRTSLKMLLESWGCEVWDAASSQDAMEVIRTSGAKYQLIVADYRLRNETGPQAIQAVSDATGRSVPAIILTGDTAPERIAEVSAHGYRVLHKPVAAQNLRAAICAQMAGTPCSSPRSACKLVSPTP